MAKIKFSDSPHKPTLWIPAARADLQAMPKRIRYTVGSALRSAQLGAMHPKVKVLQGFDGAGVLEVIENDSGSTYRAVYTVRFGDVVFVLHVFQKKSKKGAKTPKFDIDLIKTRLKAAELRYAEYKRQKMSETEEKPSG
jgi:phage-related protein